jgi:hypothetical protein
VGRSGCTTRDGIQTMEAGSNPSSRAAESASVTLGSEGIICCLSIADSQRDVIVARGLDRRGRDILYCPHQHTALQLVICRPNPLRSIGNNPRESESSADVHRAHMLNGLEAG